jgi:EpsI family protein
MSAQSRRHWLLLAIVLLATFGVRSRLGASPTVPLLQPLQNFPASVGAWTLESQPRMTSDVLGVLKADDYLLRNYRNAQGQPANFFVAYYRSQHAGEAMHSPKNCLPGSGWEPILDDTVPLAAAGEGVAINRYVVENSGDRQLVLYWYQAQDHIIASEYMTKAFLIWDSVRTGRRDGAIVRVVVPMAPGESFDAATQRALSFANPSLPLLNHFLPQ